MFGFESMGSERGLIEQKTTLKIHDPTDSFLNSNPPSVHNAETTTITQDFERAIESMPMHLSPTPGLLQFRVLRNAKHL